MGPAAPAPAAPTEQSSGGTTIETAQPVARGETVQGVVTDTVPSRYYRLDLKTKEDLELAFYAQDPSGMGYANVSVLDTQGGTLGDEMLAVNARTDWDVDHLKFTAKQDGTYIVRALCSQNCRTGKISYKIVVK